MLNVLITTKKKNSKESGRKLLEVMDMFMAQIVVMISQAYIQTHPVVCIKRV